MKFKVMGNVIVGGKRRKICYYEVDDYTTAYEYKEWLEAPVNWKHDPKKQPYMVYIKEIKTEGDKYFDEAMNNEEQNDY